MSTLLTALLSPLRRCCLFLVHSPSPDFQGQTKPNQLHRLATRYVSAKAQASLIEKMLEQELLTEKELDIYKRGRNANSHTKAKNTDVITYKMSTGFEAVMGYLHMTEDIARLEELIAWCIDEVEKEI